MFVLLASGSIGASAMMTPERTAPPKQYSIALNQHANGLRRDTSNAPVNNKQTVKKYHIKTTRNLTVPGVTHHTPVHTRPHFRNPLNGPKKKLLFCLDTAGMTRSSIGIRFSNRKLLYNILLSGRCIYLFIY